MKLVPAPIPCNEAERLSVLGSYEILDTKAEAVFDRLVEMAARLTDCPVALISLADSKRQWLKARPGLNLAEMPRDHAFCAHAMLCPTGPLVVEDATRDPRFAGNLLVRGKPGLRFHAGMPLVGPDDRALGTLCVFDIKARSLDAAQREALVSLASLAATVLELRRKVRHGRAMAA